MENRTISPAMVVRGGYDERAEGHEGVTIRRPIGDAFVVGVVDQSRRLVVVADDRIITTINNRPNLKVILP